MNIVFIGPQGSGKGTQSRLLVKNYNLGYVEMGQILREKAKAPTAEGRFIKDYLNTGQLFPDETINQFFTQYMDERWGKFPGFLLDAYPRKIGQVTHCDEYFKSKKSRVHAVFFLNIDEDTSIKRLAGRVTYLPTGEVYNWNTNPPPANIADDHENLHVRDDETPEAIKQRLDHYKTLTMPIVEVYRQRGILKEINGKLSVADVHQQIIDHIEKLHLS